MIFLFITTKNQAQCAGTDFSSTICKDELIKDSSKAIDLFDLLKGNPAPGGTWIDNSKSLEEGVFNGVINAQSLRNSGVYTYTYVFDPSSCTIDENTEATVTINIGPYTGTPSPNVSACDDMESYNLFLAFDGTKLPPQQNGTWTITGTTTSLSGSTINPKALGVGTYSYTYTIAAVDDCEAESATVMVSVFRKPVSGDPLNLILCSTDDMTPYKNLNLNDRLVGEDTGGKWSDLSGTNELTSPTDNKIDVENIYNTFGAGTYNFVYTVLSANPICTESKTTVQIIIEEPLDFTGATLVVNSDICETEIATATYTATLKKGPKPIPNGNYDISYTISNGTTTKTINVNGDFVNGNFVFDVDSANLPAVGNYTFTITNIVYNGGYRACTNIVVTISDVLTISPLPRINTGTLTINPVCKGLAAQVELSGDTNLINGNYRITYNLSGNNTANNQQLVFTIIDGVANFAIPANLTPNVGVNTVFTITNIVNLTTGCVGTASLSKAFTVKALPNVSAVAISINATCLNQEATVQLSGLGSLTDIVVNYSLSGANVLLNQNTTLTVSSGNASFVIPASVLANSGNTVFTLNSVLDNSNGCTAISLNKTKSFVVKPIPSNPVTNNFVFCKNDLSTIGSLTPNGSQYQWFDSVSSTTILSTTTLLVSGTYYVKEFNSTGCESGRTAIIVTINELATPTLDSEGQKFCGLDKPTIQNLRDRTNASGLLYWFDAAVNGNELSSDELLEEGMTYYGYNFSTATNCYSDALEVTVSLSNCEVTEDFFIPDGFSPNGDSVNDTFRIPKIQFIYPDFTLDIYNRYGNLLFKGNRDKPEWDGRNSDYKIGIDGMATNGVYFYILHLNKGNKKPIQGRLYLNR